jgi:hypothetical protein
MIIKVIYQWKSHKFITFFLSFGNSGLSLKIKIYWVSELFLFLTLLKNIINVTIIAGVDVNVMLKLE